MGEIAIGLALQTHSAELSGHIALRGGFVQGGLPDTSHFCGHKEGQHTLEKDNKGKQCKTILTDEGETKKPDSNPVQIKLNKTNSCVLDLNI